MPPITVFCPFTRLEYMDRWFDDLASTDLNPSTTDLAFIVDCKNPKIYERIKHEMEQTTYHKWAVIRNYDHEFVNQVNINIRRKRIAFVHNQSKELISSLDGQYVLGLEDDTVFTNLSVQRLFEKQQYDQVGMVTAYEAGRWNKKYIGVWDFDNATNPTECWTMLPRTGFEPITAAGFYCYVTPTHLYLAHDYHSEDWQPWGPDVNYGLWLSEHGYTNYVDWNQPCGHHSGDIIITPNSDLSSEYYVRVDDINNIPAWQVKK